MADKGDKGLRSRTVAADPWCATAATSADWADVERRLRDSEEKYRLLVTNQNELVLKVDLQGNYLFASPSYCRTFGLAEADLLGKPFMPLVHEEDRESTLRAMEQILEPPFRVYLEQRGKTCDGWRWFAWSANAVRDQAGRPCEIVSVGRDITEQKRTETALRDSEARFRRLAENAPDIIYRFSLRKRGHVEYISPAVERMLGYIAADYAADPNLVFRMTHADDRAMLERHLQRASGMGDPLVIRCFHRDGHLVWLELSDSLVEGADGLPEAIEGIARDISERKRLEQRHQAQARLLERISTDQPLTHLLEEMLLFMEAQSPGIRCSVLLADNAQGILRQGAAPSLPPTYNQLVDGTPIGEGSGSCGTAAARRESVIVTDIRTDPLWQGVRHKVAGFDWLHGCWSTPFFDSGGELLGTFAIYPESFGAPGERELDLIEFATSMASLIVERRRDQDTLRSLSRAVDQSSSHILITDGDGIVRYINKQFEHVTGFTSADVVGRPLQTLIVQRFGHAENDTCADAFRNFAEWQGEYQAHRKNGQQYWESVTLTPIRDDNGHLLQLVVVGEDISARKQAESEIRKLAFFDPLTALPNRRLLQDRLGQALDAARRSGNYGAVLFIDLDHFKQLNDARGHAVGDDLLIAVAARLQAELRRQDTVARLGGDEFVIVLVNLADESCQASVQARQVADKLRQTLSTPFRIGDLNYHLGASVGYTTFPKPDDQVDELLREADTAMYRAKQLGRDGVTAFVPAMREAAQDRFALEGDLRHAIARNELEVWLQPQVDHNGVRIGAELLLRWRHPERGLISPAAFIPVAEQSGLIIKIGDWVLGQAAQLSRTLTDHGQRLRLAVNISPRQFRQPELVSGIKHWLEASGADPELLVLEVTESLVIEDIVDTAAKMAELSTLGVRFSVDDFGTGYSSLAYLKRLPLHELKIDRTFVQDAPTDANDAALVEGILSVARHLGLQVVGEGVETPAHRDFLLERGCRYFQGYLYGVPKPLHEFLQDQLADQCSQEVTDSLTAPIRPSSTP